MKKWYLWTTSLCMAGVFLLSGCNNKKPNVWEDQKTSGQYKDKTSSLWGNSEELSQNEESEDFKSEDFIPLQEEDLKVAFTDGAIAQPRETPGEVGSSLPSVDEFQTPKQDQSAIFTTLFFNTDEHVLSSKDSLSALDRVVAYLKENPNIYLFIEGHCDERGPEAYNLSLGIRRANSVRAMLVRKGIDLNRLHTISYGKEKPAALGHDQEAWKQNRRVQFKIFNKV
jgi:peptidoglycan-associated lipoprotein